MPSALVRVRIGIDKTTAMPELCLVQRDGAKSATALVGANLIALGKPKPIDGLNVPTKILVYEAAPPEAKSFNDYPSSSLYLLPSKSSLRPVFTDEDFLPR